MTTMYEYQEPRGYIKESGISEYGMIFYNTIDNNNDFYMYKSDLFAMILPNSESLEIVTEKGEFVVKWYKDKWNSLYKKIKCTSIKDACFEMVKLNNEAIKEWHERKLDANQ